MTRCKDYETCAYRKECEECIRYPQFDRYDKYLPNDRKYCTVDDIDPSCVLDDGNDPTDCMICVNQGILDKEKCEYWKVVSK